ncbi:MAG: ACT domain-containing protein [Lachnospiraceae bacterium]|nr:ACT domain-containing protein [Lachnospiraceae bacterium]
MKRAVITVIGTDGVGIIAKICTYLAEHGVNVLDISQTIVQGIFNMMMITDVTAADKTIGAMADDLDALGAEIGVKIRIQHEDIFNTMHRI